MLITIALVHSDNRAANRIILAIFGTAVGVAVVVFELQRASPEEGGTRMRAAEPPSRFLT